MAGLSWNRHDETCGTCATPPGEGEFSGPGWDLPPEPSRPVLHADGYPDEDPL